MVNHKAKKTHKAPARIRYEQSHPTVSFRLPRELYDQLMEQLASRDITAADFVKEALGAKRVRAPNIAEIRDAKYKQGYYEGYEDGYERGESNLPYPTNLMTRRAREKAIEIYQKTMKRKG